MSLPCSFLTKNLIFDIVPHCSMTMLPVLVLQLFAQFPPVAHLD